MVAKCCSASTSVGAISAVCAPCRITTSAATTRHDGLSRTHIALEQPPHHQRRLEFPGDRGERASDWEPVRRNGRTRRTRSRTSSSTVKVWPPGRPVRSCRRRNCRPERKKEELLEDEPPVAGGTPVAERLERGAGRREMDLFQSFLPRRELQARAEFPGQVSRPDRSRRSDQPVEDPAQETRAERTDPLVNRHDPAGVGAGRGGRRRIVACRRRPRSRNAQEARGAAGVLLDQLVARVLQLGNRAGERPAHLAEQQDPLPGPQHALQMDLVEPARAHRARFVAAPQFDDPEPGPAGRTDGERLDHDLHRGRFSVAETRRREAPLRSS